MYLSREKRREAYNTGGKEGDNPPSLMKFDAEQTSAPPLIVLGAYYHETRDPDA